MAETQMGCKKGCKAQLKLVVDLRTKQAEIQHGKQRLKFEGPELDHLAEFDKAIEGWLVYLHEED